MAVITAQRDMDLQTLVEKILENSAAIIGEQQRLDELVKAVEAAQDKAAIAAVV